MYTPQPQWYQDAVIYEVHVRAFFDSVGDGSGDFAGLTQKLDYLRDLGVTAIWLLPFYPSPQRDDGYDIADYTSINPQFGTLETFRELLDAAHDRGLNVITELVLNHTSDQHSWFQRARRAPAGSPERDFYVWSDTTDKYQDARIIFKDFEVSNWTYDHVAKANYWHRFYSHQPDLNYDNPQVWQAVLPVVDFWLEMGVDGLRLDAVPYLYEREGTNCENLPETHAFLKALRSHVDERFPHRLLLAEANQWPEDAVAFFGDGDECHMCFHFPIMPRLFMSIQREDRFPVVDILDQTPALPDGCQWAMFLRNHDELTLEMVTDEERDYMYKAYAHDTRARINLGIRHRLAPLLSNNRRRIELMNSLLFSLPGAPVIYYGDEIGMGDNIYLGDRNGVRTPMQWNGDRNAGFSRANPQKLYLPVIIDPEYHYESVNVEAQQNNPQSLLWWMKRLIDVRRRHAAFSRGQLEFLHPDNRRILAFLRTHEDETLLIVANLSRYVQYVELDLSRYQGAVPVEMFGQTPFPPVGSLPYLLTLGPHAFYWFRLSSAKEKLGCPPVPTSAASVPVLRAANGWERLLYAEVELLEAELPAFLSRRWGMIGEECPKKAWLSDSISLEGVEDGGADVAAAEDCSAVQLALVEYESANSTRHATMVPLALATGQRAHDLLAHHLDRVVARVGDGVLFDAGASATFGRALLAAFRHRRRLRSRGGSELAFNGLPPLAALLEGDPAALVPHPIKAEQFNTSVQFGDRLVWKLFRLVEEGIHPEVEMGRLLTSDKRFSHAPDFLGSLELRPRGKQIMTLGVLHNCVAFESNLWQQTLNELSDFFERALAQIDRAPGNYPAVMRLPTGIEREPSAPIADLLAEPMDDAERLGRRIAEMHAALASAPEDAAFSPEPYTWLYQRSVYQSIRTLRLNAWDQLRRGLPKLPDDLRALGQLLLARGDELAGGLADLLQTRLDALRIRCHGDLTLHEVLHTGRDYLIVDFEGRVRTPLGERRIKRSPLRDVASLLHSWNYAARVSLLGLQSGRGRSPGLLRPEDAARLEPWARAWVGWISAGFVRGYQQACVELAFTPASASAWPILLRAFLLEEHLTALQNELHFRPPWARVPLENLAISLDELLQMPTT